MHCYAEAAEVGVESFCLVIFVEKGTETLPHALFIGLVAFVCRGLVIKEGGLEVESGGLAVPDDGASIAISSTSEDALTVAASSK